MKLDEAQKKQVSGWIEEGLKLSEIQNKLATEFGLNLTYMELRFLMADLGLQPKDKPEPQVTPAPANPPKATEAAAGVGTVGEQQKSAGGVRVNVDQVTRPGALVSGKVTFSDGKSAEWYLDQMGRLGLASKETGYKPSEEDVMEFQVELQSQLARLGY
jgi:hypothetical protein